MADYLPFERVSYPKATAASISELVWIWIVSVTSIPKKTSWGPYLIYTVPTGIRGVISDIGFSGDHRGVVEIYVLNGDNIYTGYFEAFIPFSHSFQLSPVAEPGESIYLSGINKDIIGGNFYLVMSMWRAPGSKPIKPKNDDPEEIFRVGDFSFMRVFFLPDGEVVYLFHKRHDRMRNYLKIKHSGTGKPKVINKFKVRNREIDKVISDLHTSPDKAVEILRKIEKKHKRS